MERRNQDNALSGGDPTKEGAGDHPYKPMSLPMRLVLAFVAANAFAGAASLMLFPAATDAGFFWALTPPVSAALFGALYLSAGGLVAWAALRYARDHGLRVAPQTTGHLGQALPDLSRARAVRRRSRRPRT